MLHHEVTIIGAGPVGLFLALKLSNQGKSVNIISDGMAQDGRILALSYASYEMLDSLGAWPSQLATPIDIVNISHNGLGVSNIVNKNIHLPHLGYTVSYNDLCSSLLTEVLQRKNINMIEARVTDVDSGKIFSSVKYISSAGVNKYITSDLVILADGGKICVKGVSYKQFDYQQKAIVAHVKIGDEISQQIAYERFSSDGALVLLPYNDHYIVVWAVDSMLSNDYLCNYDKFIKELDITFTNRLGGARLIGGLHSFSLYLQVAKTRVLPRLVLLGNSAQTVHPVSAQGLNLGLRDVQALSMILSSQSNLANNCDLSTYEQMRNKDSSFVVGFTHNLVRFLDSKSQLITHLRGAGIIGLSNIPKLQNTLANSLIFGV